MKFCNVRYCISLPQESHYLSGQEKEEREKRGIERKEGRRKRRRERGAQREGRRERWRNLVFTKPI